MKLFDPLGFVSHFTVHGKILMQEIWRTGTNWDEPIDQNLLDMWYRWTELLPLLGEVKIPRCYFGTLSSKSLQNLQVHIFVDASEVAYACVAYLRLRCTEGIRCAFVASKTKVAPLKPLSIPRLELQAAMIGARLMQTICSSLTLPISKRVLWSDSTTVLAWLRSDSRRYHQFIGFRVGEILSLTAMDEWRYVPSNDNVADEATKWAAGPNFNPDSRWYTGPEFLANPESEWPTKEERSSTTTEELRPVYLHRHLLMEKLIDETRFSNWNRMVRAMAYVYRAVAIWRKRISAMHRGAPLTRVELQAAENAVFRQAQAETYPDELALLSNQATMTKASPLYTLTPFLDDHGVVRMGSRIEAAPEASYSAKYPIILSKHHPTTALLTEGFHRRYLHGNNETVHNEMRQQYYISGLRALIRKTSRGCQVCKIKKAIPQPPIMAPLPRVRLTPFVRAFTYVGVDYFGPLEVKVGRSIVKRWAALFTCLTVRAVHLELTHSLSAKSCIMAFRRFVVRRGAPLEVYSDNGTNFVGASRQLSEELKTIQDINSQCASTFTNTYTTWHFNAPAAPHMGGPWERLVRSVKTAMKAILDCPQYLSDEVLETVLLEAEGIVNSRPLTYVPLEQADDEALTPNHFLLYGSTGVNQPEGPLSIDGEHLREGRALTQRIANDFWRRWVLEYLPMLTRRTKWFEKVKPLEPGDLVVVIDEKVRNSWTRGRILDVVKGADGQVRRATVQTAKGILSRGAVKLALLDVKPGSTSVTGDDHPANGTAHGRGDVAVTGHTGT
ncbi:uncharacterized protein LOC134290392 [Aedes albopictus]|uniref:Integrase catalytic domain-containing protein n=1 Tax=Aedes albopictus TaxID=7160 RepID=A0ABM2A707_AEDAL